MEASQHPPAESRQVPADEGAAQASTARDESFDSARMLIQAALLEALDPEIHTVIYDHSPNSPG